MRAPCTSAAIESEPPHPSGSAYLHHAGCLPLSARTRGRPREDPKRRGRDTSGPVGLVTLRRDSNSDIAFGTSNQKARKILWLRRHQDALPCLRPNHFLSVSLEFDAYLLYDPRPILLVLTDPYLRISCFILLYPSYTPWQWFPNSEMYYTSILKQLRSNSMMSRRCALHTLYMPLRGPSLREIHFAVSHNGRRILLTASLCSKQSGC